MHKILMRVAVALSLLVLIPQASAALSLGNTRLVVNDNSSGSIEVINDATTRYGMQAWVEDDNGKDPGKALVVTPGFMAINGKNKVVLRLLSFSATKEKEQIYYLNVQEIPPKQQDDGHSRLALAIRTKIKVLVRPASLQAKRKDAEQEIQVRRTASGLEFTNPTPYFFAVSEVNVGGKTLTKTPLGTFAPESHITLKGISAANTLTVSCLDDYGAHQTYTLKVQ